jgi:hypothetical protein
VAGVLQIEAVKNVVIPIIAHHPHFATIFGGLLTLGTLLTNPVVQKAIHYHAVITPPETESSAV